MSINTMKLALEALKWASDQTEPQANDYCLCPICKSIDELSQAIEQAQEPVAWRREHEGDVSDLCQWLYADEYEPKDNSPNWQPLYTSPQVAEPQPQRQPLMDELPELPELPQFFDFHKQPLTGWYGRVYTEDQMKAYATEAIKAAHGITGEQK
jgi:hypothetical protein